MALTPCPPDWLFNQQIEASGAPEQFAGANTYATQFVVALHLVAHSKWVDDGGRLHPWEPHGFRSFPGRSRPTVYGPGGTGPCVPAGDPHLVRDHVDGDGPWGVKAAATVTKVAK